MDTEQETREYIFTIELTIEAASPEEAIAQFVEEISSASQPRLVECKAGDRTLLDIDTEEAKADILKMMKGLES